VVLFPAPLGPKKPKISPFSTKNEILLTATTSPKDLVRDFVLIEYNTLIASDNYKMLRIDTVDPQKKFKDQKGILGMKGLCQKCHSSNVEVTVQEGIPVCSACSKKID